MLIIMIRMSNDWSCLERAKEFGDCTLVTSLNQNASDEDYACCSHFVPEVWDTDNLGEVGATGVIDRLSAMGTIGEEFWFVPKFTAQSDPTLTNYIGLAGEENRQKLADRFKRPVRWGTYCLEVSTTNCTAPDNVAARAPQSREEANSFFNHPNFTGYFRKTYKNDCVLNPFNCTGTVIDYPCGWTSYVIPQIYHLGIALDTDGREAGSGGYTYEEMVQIFYASNYTKSDIISFWWTPEAVRIRTRLIEVQIVGNLAYACVFLGCSFTKDSWGLIWNSPKLFCRQCPKNVLKIELQLMIDAALILKLELVTR
jgi:hypothetical protein